MRKSALFIVGLVMMVGLSGCQAWWSETFATNFNSNYGHGQCQINLPANQPSGWIYEKIVDSTAGGATNTNFIDAHITILPDLQPYHAPGPDLRLWNFGGGSAGAKPILGLYPGEGYRMGINSQAPNASATVRSHVVDGNGFVLTTDGTMPAGVQCPIVNE